MTFITISFCEGMSTCLIYLIVAALIKIPIPILRPEKRVQQVAMIFFLPWSVNPDNMDLEVALRSGDRLQSGLHIYRTAG